MPALNPDSGIEFVAEQYACLQSVEQAEQQADGKCGTHLKGLFGHSIHNNRSDDAEHYGYDGSEKTLQNVRHASSIFRRLGHV